MALAAPSAYVAALIKPQFEIGPEKIGKGGIVSADEDDLNALCETIKIWFSDAGWSPCGIIESPITGGDGNREFLIAATR